MRSVTLVPLSKPAEATIAIPGSKSYTNRALLMAAMSKRTVLIANPLISDDTEAMMRCLETLGVVCTKNEKSITVSGDLDNIPEREYDLDANLSGTTIRFMLALSAVIPGTKILRGKEGLQKRPISDLVAGLCQLGARIEYLENEGFPPLCVSSSSLSPGSVRMNGGVSSQYFSALLMIAPRVGSLKIEVIGEQISKPYIDMTIDTMKQFGVIVQNNSYRSYVVADRQHYATSRYAVEGDVSSASYFFAIAALTNSRITLTNLNQNSVQGDMKFLKIVEDMGNDVLWKADEVTIQGRGIRAVEVNMEDCPDQAQTLAVLAAFARGVTKISGIRSLRVKETERVKAMQKELAKMGIKTEATQDSLTIYGGAPKAAAIDTHGDHRMAMSFAVAGTKLSGMQIHDPTVVNKTFPQFWEKLQSIGAKVQAEVV